MPASSVDRAATAVGAPNHPLETGLTLRGSVILTALLCANVLNYVDRQIFAILTPAIKADMELSDSELGALSGLAFALLNATIALPLARWANVGPRRMILAGSVVIWSLFTAACGLATNFKEMLLARAGVAAGEASASPTAQAIIADVFSPNIRATAMSVLGLGAPLGILCGLSIGGWLAQVFDWRMAFFIAAAPGLIVGPAVALILGRQAGLRKSPSASASASITATAQRLLSFPSFRFLLAATSFQGIINFAFAQWSPSVLVRSYGFGLAEAGLTLGLLLGVGGAIGTIGGGWLADRWARRSPSGRLLVCMVALSMNVLCSTSALLQPNPLLWILLSAVAVVGNFAFMGPLGAITQIFAKDDQRAGAAGIVLFVLTMVGLGLGPQLVGLLSDGLGATMGEHSLRAALTGVIMVTGLPGIICYGLAARAFNADSARTEA